MFCRISTYRFSGGGKYIDSVQLTSPVSPRHVDRVTIFAVSRLIGRSIKDTGQLQTETAFASLTVVNPGGHHAFCIWSNAQTDRRENKSIAADETKRDAIEIFYLLHRVIMPLRNMPTKRVKPYAAGRDELSSYMDMDRLGIDVK